MQVPKHIDQRLDFRTFEDTWIHDAQSRQLHLQNIYQASDHQVLDLSPALEYASGLGPRAGLDALGPAPARRGKA